MGPTDIIIIPLMVGRIGSECPNESIPLMVGKIGEHMVGKLGLSACIYITHIGKIRSEYPNESIPLMVGKTGSSESRSSSIGKPPPILGLSVTLMVGKTGVH